MEKWGGEEIINLAIRAEEGDGKEKRRGSDEKERRKEYKKERAAEENGKERRGKR